MEEPLVDTSQDPEISREIRKLEKAITALISGIDVMETRLQPITREAIEGKPLTRPKLDEPLTAVGREIREFTDRILEGTDRIRSLLDRLEI